MHVLKTDVVSQKLRLVIIESRTAWQSGLSMKAMELSSCSNCLLLLLLHQEKLLASDIKLFLQFGHLVLQHGNDAQAPVYRVLLSSVGLVSNGFYCVLTLGRVDMFEDAQNVADAEEFVDVGEALGLVRGEVRRERTICRTFSPLILAGRTRCVGAPT